MLKNKIKKIFYNLQSYIKPKYLPLLSVYFAFNFSNFYKIAEKFWIKESLSLSASQIISITILGSLPWTLKIFFGQLIDGVKIFGSNRRSYIFIGAILLLVNNFLTLLVVKEFIADEYIYIMLVIADFIANSGFVLQDLVADTMCYEVVDRKNKDGSKRVEEEIKEEVANVQVLIRIICIPLASLCSVYLSSVIAKKYDFVAVCYMLPSIAFISIIGAFFCKKEPKIKLEPLNYNLLKLGSLYLLFILLSVIMDIKYSQEILFLIGIIVVSFSLKKLCQDFTPAKRKKILAILVVIFACRVAPEHGPVVEWWQIDVLGFTQEFFVRLRQVGLVLGFLGLWFFGKRLIKFNMGLALLGINTLHVILQLPIIGMAFGLHEWTIQNFNFGAKEIAMIDVVAESPFVQLNFFLLCTVITYHAPEHNRGTWFALTMSLMSLAYVSGGRIIKRIISDIFIVERGIYENIANQMIYTCLLDFLIPTIAILIFMNPFKKKAILPQC